MQNMTKAGFPAGYVEHFFDDDEFPVLFEDIDKKFKKKSCGTCRCYLLKGMPDQPDPPHLKGILQKSEVTEPISFASIKTQKYLDIRVPSDRPARVSTCVLHCPDRHSHAPLHSPSDGYKSRRWAHDNGGRA